MINRSYFFATLFSLSAVISMPAPAQEKDVDQADSLDFESFHKDKKAAVKIWEDGVHSAPVKTYEQTAPSTTTDASASAAPKAASNTPAIIEKPIAPTGSATTKATTTNNAAASAATSAAAAITSNKAATSSKPGQRYELRERYTLTTSTSTAYSATTVATPLYQQAAQWCTHGWKKLAERSEPIEQDFYLYNEIECL